jgi:hypothetical protein
MGSTEIVMSFVRLNINLLVYGGLGFEVRYLGVQESGIDQDPYQ